MGNRARIRRDAMSLNPIDDALFQKMAEDRGFCQEILQVILNDKALQVMDNVPQFMLKNLQGRSCILDVKCTLGDGRIVNAEVQKSDNDDHQRRVRYNAALLTANIAEPGDRFKAIPDVVVVFISKFDMYKSGKALYHVDRIIRENGTMVDNGFSELYVNAEVQDDSDVAKLMDIFTRHEAYDDEMFPITSKRKRLFKTTEEGVNEMCEVIEKYIAEGRREGIRKGRSEGRREGKAEAIRNLMESMSMTAEQAMKALDTSRRVRKIYDLAVMDLEHIISNMEGYYGTGEMVSWKMGWNRHSTLFEPDAGSRHSLCLSEFGKGRKGAGGVAGTEAAAVSRLQDSQAGWQL